LCAINRSDARGTGAYEAFCPRCSWFAAT